jgi:hypothetical protein
MERNRMSYNQGKYNIPDRYKHKYIGDKSMICYRSNWELEFFRYLSRTSSVLAWNSEDVVISYFNPIKQRKARYFMDIWFRYQNRKNQICEILVEVKPFCQCIPPKMTTTKTGRETAKRKQRYLNQLATYQVNLSKWEATYEHCKKNGLKFYILTDDVQKSSRQRTIYKLWTYEQLILGEKDNG